MHSGEFRCKELYPSCKESSKLILMVQLLHNVCTDGWVVKQIIYHVTWYPFYSTFILLEFEYSPCMLGKTSLNTGHIVHHSLDIMRARSRSKIE